MQEMLKLSQYTHTHEHMFISSFLTVLPEELLKVEESYLKMMIPSCMLACIGSKLQHVLP